MLRLRPLAETISGQELIKEERIALLTRQIRRKFALSDELTDGVGRELQKLEAEVLTDLAEAILDLPTFEQLEQWITDHLPTAPKPTRKRTRRKS